MWPHRRVPPYAAPDLSDLLPDYTRELADWRLAVTAVAREIGARHLRDAPAATPFGERLRAHLDALDPALPTPPGPEAVASYAAGGAHRASMAWFLAGLLDAAGEVLRGRDLLRLLHAKAPREVRARWEDAMLRAPILAPCRAFAARALAARLDAPRVVLEGGAGVGVVLRTMLADPRLAPRARSVAVYHFTELDPAILALGRDALAREAPPALFDALHFRRLDLDALPRDPAGAAGVAPGSVDCVVLEHVLYDVADLHGTLTALRALLRPDGALVFTGAFRGEPGGFFPCEALQLALASYTRARLDPPWRRQAGYLSLDEWRRSLARAGFDCAFAPAEQELAARPHGGVIAWPA